VDDDTQNYDDLDLESLKTLVENKRSQLAVLERHQTEKEELTNLAERWKEAGLVGIKRFREIIQPPRTIEEILDSFKIPHEVFL